MSRSQLYQHVKLTTCHSDPHLSQWREREVENNLQGTIVVVCVQQVTEKYNVSIYNLSLCRVKIQSLRLTKYLSQY
jgi:hypothetical protein